MLTRHPTKLAYLNMLVVVLPCAGLLNQLRCDEIKKKERKVIVFLLFGSVLVLKNQ